MKYNLMFESTDYCCQTSLGFVYITDTDGFISANCAFFIYNVYF